jgi:hypothetical protein
VGDKLPLAEERGWAAVGVQEPVEQLGGKLGQPGANEAPREGVETVLVIEREANQVIAGVEDELCRSSADLSPVSDTDAKLDGGEGVADAFAYFGKGDASDEAIPGIANAERTRVAILLGDEDGSGTEPDLRAELAGEHEIAEGGEELAGTGAVCAIAKKDGFHGGVCPSRGPSGGINGELLQDCHHIAGGDREGRGLSDGCEMSGSDGVPV